MALLCMGIVLVTALLGIFAPWVAPNDPYANDILNKFDSPSWQYPLGTDHLGRCVFSRMLFGIRPTLFLSLLTMLGTIGLGVIMGITAGYFRGTVDEVIMRVVDVMLSFPSQIIILAVVALLGVDIRNVVIASIFIKWAWYARMIRTATIKYTGMNFVLFSRSIGSGNFYILTRHMLPCIAAELAVLASLDTGWAILNISTLSFLGLGVQAPVPEWGAMLNEAKNVMVSNPEQMIVPGIAVVVLIPILGENILSLFSGEITSSTIPLGSLIAGFLGAFISGWAACKFMINIVKRGKLIYFAAYCLVVGVIVILTQVL